MMVVVVCNMLLLITFLGFILRYIQGKAIAWFLGGLEFVSLFNILLLMGFVWYIWEMNRKMVLLFIT